MSNTINVYYVYRQVNFNPWERMGPFSKDEALAFERELRAGQDPEEVRVRICEVKPGETPPNTPYNE